MVVAGLVALSVAVLVPTILGPDLPNCGEFEDEDEAAAARDAGTCIDWPGWYAWYHDHVYDGALIQGLDLQGGLHMQYRVDVDTALRRKVETFSEDIADALRAAEFTIGEDDVEIVDGFVIRIQVPSEASATLDEMLELYPLDRNNESGDWVRLEMDDEFVSTTRSGAIETAISTIRSRVDSLGVAEPSIRQQGESDIIVELPGLGEDRFEEAKALIGTTAQLEFHGVHDRNRAYWQNTLAHLPDSGCLEYDPNTQTIWGRVDPPQARVENRCTIEELRLFSRTLRSLDRDESGSVPDDAVVGFLERVTYHPATGEEQSREYQMMLLDSRVEMTGENISDVRVASDPNTNQPFTSLTFDSEGAREFCEVTTDYVGQPLAILLDDIIKSAPNILEEICGGRARITMGSSGNYAAVYNDAMNLVRVLRHGALPAPIEPQFETQVGPSLGEDSVRKGTTSMIVGSIFVIIFMFIYYRKSGAIANIALGLNVLFILAALSMLEATVTLPGIAGIILTIGMAVDANVIIFERIREELRLGKTARDAVSSGYQKALWTVLDANITTGIAALVLMNYGSGPIKGFAVTLSIGIICSVFTALYVTRMLFDVLLKRGGTARLSI